MTERAAKPTGSGLKSAYIDYLYGACPNRLTAEGSSPESARHDEDWLALRIRFF